MQKKDLKNRKPSLFSKEKRLDIIKAFSGEFTVTESYKKLTATWQDKITAYIATHRTMPILELNRKLANSLIHCSRLKNEYIKDFCKESQEATGYLRVLLSVLIEDEVKRQEKIEGTGSEQIATARTIIEIGEETF
jgi:hypothetical protein